MKLKYLFALLIMLAFYGCKDPRYDFEPTVTTYYIYANATTDEISVECFDVRPPENTTSLDGAFVIAPGEEHVIEFSGHGILYLHSDGV